MEKTCLACNQPYVVGAKDPLAAVCFFEGICPGCARIAAEPQDAFAITGAGDMMLVGLDEIQPYTEADHARIRERLRTTV